MKFSLVAVLGLAFSVTAAPFASTDIPSSDALETRTKEGKGGNNGNSAGIGGLLGSLTGGALNGNGNNAGSGAGQGAGAGAGSGDGNGNQAGNGSGNGNSAGNGNGSGNGSGNHVNLCAPLSLDPNITLINLGGTKGYKAVYTGG